MLFNSYIFIFIFFPLCITGFYLLKNVDNSVFAKLWLIGLSLWFYGYFNVYYLAIMILSILLNHVLTRAIIGGKHPKLLCTAAVMLNLGILFYFKYFDFFIENINIVFKSEIPLKHILLPLGISFFTFQQIGFVVDTYRGEVGKVDFVDYALFVCFFPQLIAGPIVSSSEMLPQFADISGRKTGSESIGRGLTLFILGLAKKVLIADTLGKAVDAGYSSYLAMNGLDSFLIMIWYALQLYFDFSGYCDMARGLAMMLGFELPVNFDSPYKSGNILEFWKRWHRTLTRFFTRYVYIPLGGNRRGFVRMLINIAAIYFLSGLWHGAGYTFIVWGMMHGILYILAKIYEEKIKDKKIKDEKVKDEKIKDEKINDETINAEKINTEKINTEKIRKGSKNRIVNKVSTIVSSAVKVLFTFVYVSAAWVFFRAESISQALQMFKNMFTAKWNAVSYPLSEAFKVSEIWYIVKTLHLDRFRFGQLIPMILITVVTLLLTFFAPNAAEISERIKAKKTTAILLACIGVWCVLTLSEVSTFLYFNF